MMWAIIDQLNLESQFKFSKWLVNTVVITYMDDDNGYYHPFLDGDSVERAPIWVVMAGCYHHRFGLIWSSLGGIIMQNEDDFTELLLCRQCEVKPPIAGGIVRVLFSHPTHGYWDYVNTKNEWWQYPSCKNIIFVRT